MFLKILALFNIFLSINSIPCPYGTSWCLSSSTCNDINTCIDDQLCPIPNIQCDNHYVCPKITEITHCSENGIDSHTTYQLSLITNNNVENIYAIYGDGNNHMIIPPAYQSGQIYNSHIGGITPEYIKLHPALLYDSWLTIGITNGDNGHIISSVGINFNSWTESTGLNIDNGAIFIVDPSIQTSNTNEYVIGQLTLPNEIRTNVVVNAQGNLNNGIVWRESNIVFPISKPDISNQIAISNNCEVWFDGCNICAVNNGNIISCMHEVCTLNELPRCLSYLTTQNCQNWYYQPCNSNSDCINNYICKPITNCIASACSCSGDCTDDCIQFNGLCSLQNGH